MTSGDINSVFVQLFPLPDIFTSHFIFMTNANSKSAYSKVLNSTDLLPYLRNEAIMKAKLLLVGAGVSVCVWIYFSKTKNAI